MCTCRFGLTSRIEGLQLIRMCSTVSFLWIVMIQGDILVMKRLRATSLPDRSISMSCVCIIPIVMQLDAFGHCRINGMEVCMQALFAETQC